jgi:hypothetical protein
VEGGELLDVVSLWGKPIPSIMTHHEEISQGLKTARLVIRIYATLIMAFYFLAFVPKIIGQLTNENSDDLASGGTIGHLIIVSFLLFFLGYLLSWWRGIWGGIVLIAAGIIMLFTHIPPLAESFDWIPFAIFSGPMMLAGILYVLFWSKKV